ncbi:hypothetical protein BJ875DRAFT_544033 [Amylocarpus encephaloides]|uniref:Nucleoporin NUP49/NSP49 n=1 Tax=Amylocarpus encephaloides TaxID=45428 RepID=A0A9P7YGI6_9HELO|nr:hypothetical protein BJ875DRAFT_544033 [Amylocarpus encephaloides]
MALARSASGPGGLSINTNSANNLFGSSTPSAGAMFGSTAANKPATGLFGSSVMGTAASQSGSLFGAAPTSQPQAGGVFGTAASQPQTGGLFGSAATTSQPQLGGLFGAANAATEPQSGGLFGATTPAAPSGLFGGTKPQIGGLFGSSMTTSQPQTGGLFGAGATATQPQQTGGLFGAAPAKPAEGLFGSTSTPQTSSPFGGLNNQNQQNKPATSLFGGLGSTQNQGPQQQQNSMFASQNQNQGPGLLAGGLSLGQGNQQNAQTVPGVRIDVSNLRGTTRYNDLYEELQQEFTKMDQVIQGQIKLKNDCDAILPAHDQQLSRVPADVAFCNRKLTGVEGALISDVKSIAYARELVKIDAENAKLSFKAIDNLKLPAQYHNQGMWSTTPSDNRDGGEEQDIVGLFSKTADELSATLNKNQNTISEIEQHLRNVEAGSAQQISAFIARRNGSSAVHEDPVAELAAALREFEQSILSVAGNVGGARESVQNLQLGGFSAPSNGSAGNGRRSGVY